MNEAKNDDKNENSDVLSVEVGPGVDLMHIKAKMLISQVEKEVDDSVGNARYVKSWLALYDNETTLSLAEKEVRRLFFWLKCNSVSLCEFNTESARKYLNNLSDPQPKDLWVGPKCRKYEADGSLNPKWRPLAGPLGATSVRLSYSLCRSFFNHLVSQGLIETNAFAGLRIGQIKTSKSSERPRSALSKSARVVIAQSIDELKIKSPAKGYRLKWIFDLLLVTGMRRSECVMAKVGDLQIEDGCVWLYVVGKGNVSGKIPIPDFLVGSLLDYLKYSNHEVCGLQDLLTRHPTLPLVGSYLKVSRSITKESLWHSVNAIGALALLKAKQIDADVSVLNEVSLMSTHWFRHTSASVQLNELGLNVVQVRDNLRHANIATTSKYLSSDEKSRHQLVSAWNN